MKQGLRFLWLGLGFLAACGGGGGDSGAPVRQANRAPTLTSALEIVFPQTRTGTAYRITASDADGDRLSYAIAGADARSFTLNQETGELSFAVAPDVDAPGSVDGDNFYFIDVTVRDPSLASATQQVIIEVARHDPQGRFLSVLAAPYQGPDTIVASDPSTLQSVVYVATVRRTIPDNRGPNDVDTEVHVFDALFSSGTRVEMVVNTAIAPLSAAEEQARFYARILGQLDPILVSGIPAVWIHPGNALITAVQGGGIVMHTGTAESEFIPRGVLEEVMAHEAVHAALDATYRATNAWQRAQRSDVVFVSEYARDFPGSEDLAESYVAYLIVKNAGRNPPGLVRQIEEAIPARLAFFRSLGL
jgi:hypothetical protein